MLLWCLLAILSGRSTIGLSLSSLCSSVVVTMAWRAILTTRQKYHALAPYFTTPMVREMRRRSRAAVESRYAIETSSTRQKSMRRTMTVKYALEATKQSQYKAKVLSEHIVMMDDDITRKNKNKNKKYSSHNINNASNTNTSNTTSPTATKQVVGGRGGGVGGVVELQRIMSLRPFETLEEKRRKLLEEATANHQSIGMYHSLVTTLLLCLYIYYIYIVYTIFTSLPEYTIYIYI